MGTFRIFNSILIDPKFAAISVVLLLSNCAQESGIDSITGKRSGANGFDAGDKTETFDFQKECGLSKDQLEKKDAVLVSGSYTSFPIIVQGSDKATGTPFVVITQARVNLSVSATQTVQETNVELKESATGAGGFIKLIADAIAKKKAQDAARANSGSTTSLPLPRGEWLKLTDGRSAEFKNLLCATSGTKTLNINKGGQNATITFTPALISGVSPVSPLARLRKEMGTSRSFAVTADVQGQGQGLAQGIVQGRVSVREVSPIFKYENNTVKADIAYEFINEFADGAHKVGLPKRQVLFIDSTKKQIKAIISESDQIDPNSQKPVPIVYLIRDP